MNKQEIQKLEIKIFNKLSRIKESDTVIAAISGGADSIFLLHFLKQLDCNLIVAHLNHQIRKEANSDEEFVEQMAAPTKFESKRLNIEEISKKQKKGLEEIGRMERYKFFNKLAQKYQAKFITTAHHADDNLETIILNLSRGASLEGLAGMQELEGNLFRPLLEVSKKQILSYLASNNIPHKEDHTNNDKNYSRNFVRLEIIPKLKELNPSLEETVARNSRNLRSLSKELEEKAQNWINENQLSESRIPLKNFNTLSPTLKQYILRQLHQNLIGHCNNLESIHIEEVLTLISRNIGKKRKKLGKLSASIEKQHLLLKKASS